VCLERFAGGGFLNALGWMHFLTFGVCVCGRCECFMKYVGWVEVCAPENKAKKLFNVGSQIRQDDALNLSI